MVSKISRRTWLIVAIALMVVVAALAIGLGGGSGAPSDSTPNGQPAPDFTLPTMRGANITLSDLKGAPVVLNFWSIWCAACRHQLPYLEAVARQSEGKLKVIGINIVDSAEKLQDFFHHYEPTMLVALDSNRQVFANYCRTFGNWRPSIPFTLLVDEGGIVRYVRIGAFASEAALKDALKDALGISIPETP